VQPPQLFAMQAVLSLQPAVWQSMQAPPPLPQLELPDPSTHMAPRLQHPPLHGE